MKGKGLGIFAVVVAVVAFVASKYKTAVDNLYMGDVKLAEPPVINKLLGVPTGLSAKLLFPITNPSGQTLTMTGFNGALKYKGATIAPIIIAGKQVIAAGKTINIPVNVEVSFIKVGFQIPAIFKAGGNVLTGCNVEGNLLTMNLTIKQNVKIF